MAPYEPHGEWETRRHKPADEYFTFKRHPKFDATNFSHKEDSYRKWLKKETMVRKKRHGGLGVPDWEAQVGALQTQWVVR